MVQTDPAPARTGAPEPSRPGLGTGEAAGLAVRDVVGRVGGRGRGGARRGRGSAVGLTIQKRSTASR